MKTQGYIRLHRSLMEWHYSNNPSMLAVWTHLLMLAEYEDCQYEGVTVHRGELLVSQQWLAQKVGISEKQLRLCLRKLEEDNEISKKRAGKRTIISILKYADYQSDTNNVPQERAIKTPKSLPEKGQQKGDIGKNINNKKNLSDGEIQKGDRRSFVLQLDASEAWKQKCCRDYRIEPSQINRHIVAFHEYLLRNAPNKSWLSFNDFCLHFHSWLRFQTPESIKRLTTQAVLRSREQKAKQIEEKRKEQMWKEISEAKSRAVSYEEYLKNKHDPLGG